MKNIPYNRENAVEYARKWALGRNPDYYDFSDIGGDCTNFASQCIYAGAGVMNYTPITGWYYKSLNDRTASWTGVKYFSEFLLNNKSVGPYARVADEDEAEPGDIVQLAMRSGRFYHSLVILETEPEILIATHSYNALDRPLSSYNYDYAMILHIDGVRV